MFDLRHHSRAALYQLHGRPHRSALARRLLSGFALQDLLLSVAAMALLVGIGTSAYSKVRDGLRVQEHAEVVLELSASIRKHLAKAHGDYDGLSPARVNALGLVRSPLRWDGTNLRDGWGNLVRVYGQGPYHFSIVVGGSGMSAADCATMATSLANAAWQVRVGSAAAICSAGTCDGTVQGGWSYKAGAQTDMAALTSGCAEANPRIGGSFLER